MILRLDRLGIYRLLFQTSYFMDDRVKHWCSFVAVGLVLFVIHLTWDFSAQRNVREEPLISKDLDAGDVGKQGIDEVVSVADASHSTDASSSLYNSGLNIHTVIHPDGRLLLEWASIAEVGVDRVEEIVSGLRDGSFGGNRESSFSFPLDRQTVIQYIGVTLSMASPPRRALEFDDFIIFSGGNRTYPVFDFSAGLVVDLRDGTIYRYY